MDRFIISAGLIAAQVSNLQVDATTLALGAGTALAPYAGPNPPQGSTFHRCVRLLSSSKGSQRDDIHSYVILLFSQPAGWTPPAAVASLPATVSGARLNFDWQAFVANANLGEPVGGMCAFLRFLCSDAALTVAQGSARLTPAPLAAARARCAISRAVACLVPDATRRTRPRSP